jgi:hypothetical protein
MILEWPCGTVKQIYTNNIETLLCANFIFSKVDRVIEMDSYMYP